MTLFSNFWVWPVPVTLTRLCCAQTNGAGLWKQLRDFLEHSRPGLLGFLLISEMSLPRPVSSGPQSVWVLPRTWLGRSEKGIQLRQHRDIDLGKFEAIRNKLEGVSIYKNFQCIFPLLVVVLQGMVRWPHPNSTWRPLSSIINGFHLGKCNLSSPELLCVTALFLPFCVFCILYNLFS